MTTQNTGTMSRGTKPVYLFVFLRLTQSAYQDLLHLYPFFLHKNVCNFFFMVGKNSTVHGDRVYLPHSLVTMA